MGRHVRNALLVTSHALSRSHTRVGSHCRCRPPFPGPAPRTRPLHLGRSHPCWQRCGRRRWGHTRRCRPGRGRLVWFEGALIPGQRTNKVPQRHRHMHRYRTWTHVHTTAHGNRKQRGCTEARQNPRARPTETGRTMSLHTRVLSNTRFDFRSPKRHCWGRCLYSARKA